MFSAITILGVPYHIWLCIALWLRGGRARPLSEAVSSDGMAAPDLRVVYRQGFLINLLDIKVALFIIAFLPALVDPRVRV